MSTEPLLRPDQRRRQSSANGDNALTPEPHRSGSKHISDAILGATDGLTVPFALTASLSSLGSSNIVVIAGLAELLSGAISMGVGGFLSGKNEYDHYMTELAREKQEIEEVPHQESDECISILRDFGVSKDLCRAFVHELRADKAKWVDFMMKFELGLGEQPERLDAVYTGAVIGGAYFVGGLVPLLPYFFLDTWTALWVSVGVTAVTLFIFGYIKTYVGRKNKVNALKGGIEVLLIGAIAAVSAYGIVRLIGAPDEG